MNNLEQLRDLFFGKPTSEAWAALIEVVDPWTEEDLEVGLDHASEHLERWPEARGARCRSRAAATVRCAE